MALQISLPDSNIGIAVTEAYARIVAYSFDFNANRLQVAVNIYVNKEARLSGKNTIGGGVLEGNLGDEGIPNFDDPNNGGVRPMLYTWLKSQSQFSGSIDV